MSSTLQFNVQLASEVRARTSGQRAQIWLLALVVPALFFYLRLLNPDFLEVLDTTALGRYVLVPVAVFLEVLGIVLSFRLVRVQV
jgi:Flp pilus assembly protein TadB